MFHLLNDVSLQISVESDLFSQFQAQLLNAAQDKERAPAVDERAAGLGAAAAAAGAAAPVDDRALRAPHEVAMQSLACLLATLVGVESSAVAVVDAPLTLCRLPPSRMTLLPRRNPLPLPLPLPLPKPLPPSRTRRIPVRRPLQLPRPMLRLRLTFKRTRARCACRDERVNGSSCALASSSLVHAFLVLDRHAKRRRPPTGS